MMHAIGRGRSLNVGEQRNGFMQHELMIFSAIGALAMFVQSFFGFAGSLTAIPLFSLFFSIREVLPAYTFVMIAVDIWLVAESRQHIQWRQTLPLFVTGCLAVPLGAYGLRYLSLHVIHWTVSVVTCTFAILFLLRVNLSLRENKATQMGVGLLCGFLQGCIGQAGPPLVLYGTARQWDKNTFRSTLLTFFLCLFVISIGSYARFGLITRHSGFLFVAGVFPAFVAASLGLRLKDRVSDVRFRQGILLVVLAVGVVSVVRVMY
jgi:uncharacterized membrane protein YfcA